MKRNLAAESSSSSHSGKALPGSYMHPVFTLVCFSKRIKTLLALKKKEVSERLCFYILGPFTKKNNTWQAVFLAGRFLGRPFSWQACLLCQDLQQKLPPPLLTMLPCSSAASRYQQQHQNHQLTCVRPSQA